MTDTTSTVQKRKTSSPETGKKRAVPRTAALLLSLLLLTLSLSGVLSSCSASRLYSEGSGDLKVVCTNFPPFDFARVVGGENVTVTILQDNGADLHNYSPTAATLSAIASADIFICIGGESDEKWVGDAIAAANDPTLTVLKLIDFVEPASETREHYHTEGHKYYLADGDEEGDEEDEPDEHVWLSLKNAVTFTEKIADAFAEKDPQNADGYRLRQAAFAAELEALDAEFAGAVGRAERDAIIFADRFPFIYLMRDYGIGFLAAFSGCSTEVDASFAVQTALTKAVTETGAKAVAVLEGDRKPLAESIARETGATVVTLDSLQAVTRGDITGGATYISLMKKNLEALKILLGIGE